MFLRTRRFSARFQSCFARLTLRLLMTKWLGPESYQNDASADQILIRQTTRRIVLIGTYLQSGVECQHVQGWR